MAKGSHTGFAFLVAWLHGHSTRAARSTLGFREERAAPTHVTRLHRYEHAGLDAMIQAETLWQSTPTEQALEKIVDDLVGTFTRRAKFSSRQVDWLLQHRQESEQKQKDAGSAHASQGQAAGPTGTRLSSLGSQYVGPVGIGTVIAPAGCTRTPGMSLTYIPHGASSSLQQSQECHAQDQTQIWMVFDTGSTNLWVSSDLCKGPCAAPQRKHYDHSLSQTFASENNGVSATVTFGTGSVSGPFALDDFHVGPFTVYNQSFGMIETEEGSIFEQVPFEGILGLALPEMSFDGKIPFFDSIIKQKSLKRNVFAFYFSLDNPSANAVFWGGTDSKFHKGPIEYFKVQDNFYWSLNLKSFTIGGQEMLHGGAGKQEASGSMIQQQTAKAIVDTGTTFLTAEGPVFQKILELLPEVPCDDLTEESHPLMVLQLEGVSGEVHDFKLTNDQYMATFDSVRCTPAFMQMDLPPGHGPGVILGEVFLRHFYSVFDRGNGDLDDARVGLAPAAHGDNVNKHLKALTKHQPTFGGKIDV